MKKLAIEIYSDGANVGEMIEAAKKGLVSGFTTNPTLMRKAGITDYEAFAHEALAAIRDLPISFEVFSEDFAEMARQARKIAGWGANVFVKIPITNTRGESSEALVRELAGEGIKLNVTAILTLAQVRLVARALDKKVPAIVSVFAGRIADTGVDPVPHMKKARALLKALPRAKLLWASPREALNIVQAQQAGSHIITVTPALLEKLAMLGKDLGELSLDTVKMFHDDAAKAGYRL